MEIKQPDGTLPSTANCGVCGQPLVYATAPIEMACATCGRKGATSIYCHFGHYICDACHGKAALEVLRQVAGSTRSTDPAAILEQVMAHPSVNMHGPEHHSMVPAVIVAAVRNAGYQVPEGAIEKAIERGSKVPGGWCGLYGDCGAGGGVGIAVSVLTQATPLTGPARSLAIGATSLALAKMLDGQPRCCKRAARGAIEAAVDFLARNLDLILPRAGKVRCAYPARNAQCAREKCPYYAP
jgi:hypothetical protein